MKNEPVETVCSTSDFSEVQRVLMRKTPDKITQRAFVYKGWFFLGNDSNRSQQDVALAVPYFHWPIQGHRRNRIGLTRWRRE